jgi:aminopeptidase YwaD
VLPGFGSVTSLDGTRRFREGETMRSVRDTLLQALAASFFLAASVQAAPAGQDIQKLFDGERALAHIATLVDFGPKIAGGPKELEAAAYIAAEMESYGLEVQVQEFPQTFYEDYGAALSVVDGPELDPNTMLYSPAGEFLGVEIVYCGLGRPEDFEGIDVSGRIALIERGEITFASKIAAAAENGAVAGIVFNSIPGNLMATLYSMSDIPAVMISQEDGAILMGLLDEAPVSVDFSVDAEYYPSTSQNVIGTLEGLDPDQGTLYLGAHYDSVWFGPGANDDGSGIAAMLEAARVLSMRGHRTKATIQFMAFGAEEVGQSGSSYYVDTHEEQLLTQALGMINLDMIAVGDTLNIGNIGWADPCLVEYTRYKAMEMGIENWQPWEAAPNSDHAYFEWVGVPVSFLYQSLDPNYHTEDDTLDKIDPWLLERNGELATAVLYDWARNPALRTIMEPEVETVE